MGGWIIAGGLAATLALLWGRWRRLARAEFIRSYSFPRGIFDKLQAKRPTLDAKQMQLVARALRQFFLAHLLSGRQYVSMPSQVADDLWHEFILHTRSYEAFCRRAFGRFMHHTPAVALGRGDQNNTGLRRTWWWTCKDENINPRAPTRLPLLFALDAKLGVSDGFVYAPDCSKLRDHQSGTVHCGADLGSRSDSGASGCGGGGDPSGDSGCGGGCGGGGD
jgi:hypothetical protein